MMNNKLIAALNTWIDCAEKNSELPNVKSGSALNKHIVLRVNSVIIIMLLQNFRWN